MSQGRASQALLLLLAAIAGLYFLLALHPIWDIDVFWHIRAGQWILEHLALPATDVFSAVDPGRTWVPFQWLYEVICHGVDQVGGLFAVRVMHACVAAAGVVLGGLAFRKERPGLVPVAAVIAAFLFADRLRVRPDVFNLVFFWAALPLVREGRWSSRRIILLLLLSGLWANVHAGGALLVPVLVLARAGGRAGSAWSQRLSGKAVSGWEMARGVRSDLLVLLLVLGVMCVMPGFVQGVYQAFFMLGPSARFIPEWMGSIEFLLDHAAVAHEYIAGGLAVASLPLLAGAVGWRLLRRRDGGGILDLALAIPLAALSLLHVRFLWLGAPVLGFFVVHVLAAAGGGRGVAKLAGAGGLEPGEPGGGAAVVPAGGAGRVVRVEEVAWQRWLVRGLLALAGAGLLSLDVHYHVVRNGGGVERAVAGLGIDLEPGYFPEAAANFLSRAGVTGRILNHAPWGGYLLYRLWPGCRVATDGRGNFGELEAGWLAGMDSVGKRGATIADAVRTVPLDLVVHPSPFPLWDASPTELLWVYHDDYARVYLRVGADNEENLLGLARASGVELGGLPAEGDVSGWGEIQRRLVRRWAVERLFRPPHAARIEELRRRLDRQDADAVRDLAVAYFDLGLFAECRQVLLLAAEATAEEAVLAILAWWADGYRDEAVRACAALQARLAGGESLSPRALGVVSSVCRLASDAN